jgi:hypothetical protein
MKNMQMKHLLRMAFGILILSMAQHNRAAERSQENLPAPVINAPLIFLDDSDNDKNNAIVSALATAIIQQAGPIIASASLIVSIRATESPDEKDPQKLLQRVQYLEAQPKEKLSDAELKEKKIIYLSALAFDSAAAQQWVIKKVNSSLSIFCSPNSIYTIKTYAQKR